MERILSETTTRTVRLNAIDLENDSLSARCDTHGDASADDLAPTGDVIDFSGRNSVVLIKSGRRFRIIDGFARLQAAQEHQGISRVRCSVIAGIDDADAQHLAAYINGRHGRTLSREERYQWWKRDEERGIQFATKEAAATYYGVSRQTIYNYRDRLQESETTAESSSATESTPPALKPAAKANRRTANTNPTPKASEPDSTATSAAEAIGCLDAAVRMVADAPLDDLREHLEHVHELHAKLSARVAELDSAVEGEA